LQEWRHAINNLDQQNKFGNILACGLSIDKFGQVKDWVSVFQYRRLRYSVHGTASISTFNVARLVVFQLLNNCPSRLKYPKSRAKGCKGQKQTDSWVGSVHITKVQRF